MELSSYSATTIEGCFLTENAWCDLAEFGLTNFGLTIPAINKPFKTIETIRYYSCTDTYGFLLHKTTINEYMPEVCYRVLMAAQPHELGKQNYTRVIIYAECNYPPNNPMAESVGDSNKVMDVDGDIGHDDSDFSKYIDFTLAESRSQGSEIALGSNDVDGSIAHDENSSESQSQHGTVAPSEPGMPGLNQHSAPSYPSPSTTPPTPVGTQPENFRVENPNQFLLPVKPQKPHKSTCLRCKKSKRKCDGNSPCSLCVKGHKSCTPDPDRRRKDQRQLTNNQACQDYRQDSALTQLPDPEWLTMELLSLIEFLQSFKECPPDMPQFNEEVCQGFAPTTPDGLPPSPTLDVSAPPQQQVHPQISSLDALKAFRTFLLKEVLSSKAWINLIYSADITSDADPLTSAIFALRRLDMENRQTRNGSCDQGGNEYIPRIRWPDCTSPPQRPAMIRFLDATINRLAKFRQRLGQNVNMASE